MDRGAWRALIHRVAKSQTRLKRLSTRPRPAPTAGTGEPWAPAHCLTADKLGTSGSYKSIFSFSGHMACGILVPWLGIEPTCPALKSMFLTTGPPQVPKSSFLKIPAISYLVFPTMSIENCSLLVYRAASESSREGCFLVSSSFWGRQHSLGCD